MGNAKLPLAPGVQSCLKRQSVFAEVQEDNLDCDPSEATSGAARLRACPKPLPPFNVSGLDQQLSASFRGF